LRDFARERRPGHDCRWRTGQSLGNQLVQEAPGGRIETLGRPGQSCVRAVMRCNRIQQIGERMARRDDEYDAGAGDAGAQVGR